MVTIKNNQDLIIPIGIPIIVVGLANFIILAPIMDKVFPAEVFDLHLNLVMAMIIVGCVLSLLFPKIDISFSNRNETAGAMSDD